MSASSSASAAATPASVSAPASVPASVSTLEGDSKAAVAIAATQKPLPLGGGPAPELHPCFALRTPTLADQEAVNELGRYAFGGNDYVPASFPLWVTPNSGCYVFGIEYRTPSAGSPAASAPLAAQYAASFSGGQLVAVVNMKLIDDKRTAWIEGLRVHGKAQRLGLAHVLMKVVVDAALAIPCVQSIRYTTGADNWGSLALAQKLGLPVVYLLNYDYYDVILPAAAGGDPDKSTGESLEKRLPKSLATVEAELAKVRAAEAAAVASAGSPALSEAKFEIATTESVLALVQRMSAKYALPKGAVVPESEWDAAYGGALHWKRVQSNWKAWSYSAANIEMLTVEQKKVITIGADGSEARDAITLPGVQQFVDGVALTFVVVSDNYLAHLHHIKRALNVIGDYYKAFPDLSAGAKRLKEAFIFSRTDFSKRLFGTLNPHKHNVLIERAVPRPAATNAAATSSAASPASAKS